MRDCFLHVGTHKTGSSALQAFLHARRAELADVGILVPETGARPNGNHAPVLRAWCDLPVSRRLGDARARLDAEIGRFPNHALVLSAEWLEAHLRVGHASPVLEGLADKGYRVRLICYVRPQADRISASYAQIVKAFRANMSFASFLADRLGRLQLFYSRWLRIAQERGVDLVVRPYTTEVKRTGVIADFLRVIDRPDLAPDPSAFRQNPTVGSAALSAARTCMDRLGEQGISLTLRQQTHACRALERADAAHPSPAFCALTPQIRERVERQYWGDNQYLALRAFERSWDETFASDEITPLTFVDRNDPDSSGHDTYQHILEHVWPRIEKIARNEKLARPRPWDPPLRGYTESPTDLGDDV